jgi:hypothetical protein
MAGGLRNTQSSSVSARSRSRNAEVRNAPSFHSAGKSGWSTTRSPDGNLSEPAPPTTRKRLTPARFTPSVIACVPVPVLSRPGL